MMTSVGSERTRGTRDKVQISAAQLTQPQKPVVQATAEQIRLAQIIYDKNDADFEEKVKQTQSRPCSSKLISPSATSSAPPRSPATSLHLVYSARLYSIRLSQLESGAYRAALGVSTRCLLLLLSLLMEVTGKNQDDCIVALHDCNGDSNRAINILLEGSSDTTSWETVGGKKKSLGKESSENKENREKRGDREVSRGRGSSNRRGRGGNRGREIRVEENGVDNTQGERPSDRARRSRGRGFGRGRGRGTGRFSSQGMGTFNPADYTESSATDDFGTKQESWESGQNDGDDRTCEAGTWKNSIEEWTTEDWNEDLSETKVFTASSAASKNHVDSGQSLDLVALLQKPATSGQETETNNFEPSQQQNFGQALVFTNSQHNSQTALNASNASAVNSFSPPNLPSILCPGFGDLGSPKLANTTGTQILEQLKNPCLAQFTSQDSLSTNCPASTTVASSWEVKLSVSQPSVLSQLDFKSQPEPSPVLSQLSQRQQQQTTAAPAPPPRLESFSQAKAQESSPVDNSLAVSKMLHLPSLAADHQGVATHPTQQKLMKPPKRRIPPASKIPSSAVEMPGSADIAGFNVQFGALEFGLEPPLSEFGSTASYESISQAPKKILYPNDPLNTSLPISNTVQESIFATPAITSASLSCPSQSDSSKTTTSYDQASVHNRITYQSGVPPAEPALPAVTNGHSVRTQPALDAPSSSAPASEVETSLPSLAAKGSSLPSITTASTALLLSSVPPHTAALPSLPQSNELANSSLSQLSSSLSNHQSSLSSASALSSSTSHPHASVENSTVIPPSTAFSTASTLTPTISCMVAGSAVASAANNLGLNVTSVSLPAPTSRAAHLVSSGKAPPNLPQGVPPLLHNQYIVGPGGLLPAYPIYGYDDLQMLQSRLPMDYYGITFPAALTGREGSLANNPYSGDVAKFGRGDSASPAPATTLAQAQQNQNQAHHTAQQPFLNPALPPGYSYTGLPYYAGVPGVPSAFQYGPTMFVPPASAKQHNVSLNTTSAPFQQASGYGQHSYGAGYDDLTQGPAAGDYAKGGGYAGSVQAQNKPTGSGPGKGVSVTSTNTGVPDISGSVYNKTQTFDKQGFHAGTPPPFSLPSALSSAGPLNPGAAPGYAPAPFLHILPAHQQPLSQMLHHHIQQDGQGGSGQRSQASAMQQKSQAPKNAYGTSPYWTN